MKVHPFIKNSFFFWVCFFIAVAGLAGFFSPHSDFIDVVDATGVRTGQFITRYFWQEFDYLLERLLYIAVPTWIIVAILNFFTDTFENF